MVPSLLFGVLLAGATTADAAPVPATPQVASAAKDGKPICRKFTETGSLVRSYRVCKTRWEWERERENVRRLNVPNSCSGDRC